MGGLGSGRRWHVGAKNTTDDFRALDVRRWSREGLLKPGSAFCWSWQIDGETVATINARAESGRVVLNYRHRSYGEEWVHEDYPVALTITDCHIGGVRQWFLCPAHGCGRRVAILYGGTIFACRQCHRLAYPSQREGYHDRAGRMAERIRAKLDWTPGTANGHGLKPKGMHWRTFDRLVRRHDAFDQASWAAFLIKFGDYIDP